MLKEITINEFLQTVNKPVYLLDTEQGMIVTVEDWFKGVRILVEESPEKQPLMEHEVTKVITETPEKPKPKAKPSNKDIVLKAWRKGERTVKQVMEETGLSYATVHKYLPC